MQAKFSCSFAALLPASATPPATQKPTPARVVSFRNSRRSLCCSKGGSPSKKRGVFAREPMANARYSTDVSGVRAQCNEKATFFRASIPILTLAGELLWIGRIVAAHRVPEDAVQGILVRHVSLFQIEC